MALVVFKGFPTPPSHFPLREMKRSTLFLSRVKIEDWCQSFWDDNIMASIWGYDTGIDDRIKLLFSPDPVIRRVSRDIDHIMTAGTWLQWHDCSVLDDSLWGIKTWWLSGIRSYVAVCSHNSPATHFLSPPRILQSLSSSPGHQWSNFTNHCLSEWWSVFLTSWMCLLVV